MANARTKLVRVRGQLTRISARLSRSRPPRHEARYRELRAGLERRKAELEAELADEMKSDEGEEDGP